MNGKLTLFIDQYNQHFWASNLRELQKKVGGGRISKMYNIINHRDYHIGYVIGGLWLTAYIPYRGEV